MDWFGVSSLLRAFTSSANSGGHGEMEEVEVEGSQITAVDCSAEHGVAQEFACDGLVLAVALSTEYL